MIQYSLRPNDIVILVVGKTGAGKSTFISTLTHEPIEVGHSLDSCTQRIGIYSFYLNSDQRVYLIDTPGFDDSIRSDAEIFLEIAFSLAQLYRANVQIGGIILMHDIQSQSRMTGSSKKQLEVVKRLCGQEAYKSIVCVTSMWNTMSDAARPIAETRELQLCSRPEYWQPIITAGGTTMRWFGESENTSGLDIIRYLVRRVRDYGRVTLRLQEELVDQNIEVQYTESGSYIGQELLDQIQIQQNEIIDTNREIQHAQVAEKDAVVQILLEEREEFQANLKKYEDAQRKLEQTLAQLTAESEAKYAKIFEEYQKLADMQAGANSPPETALIPEANGKTKTKNKIKRRFLDALPLLGVLMGIASIVVGATTGDGGLVASGINKMSSPAGPEPAEVPA